MLWRCHALDHTRKVSNARSSGGEVNIGLDCYTLHIKAKERNGLATRFQAETTSFQTVQFLTRSTFARRGYVGEWTGPYRLWSFILAEINDLHSFNYKRKRIRILFSSSPTADILSTLRDHSVFGTSRVVLDLISSAMWNLALSILLL